MGIGRIGVVDISGKVSYCLDRRYNIIYNMGLQTGKDLKVNDKMIYFREVDVREYFYI